MTGSGDRLSSLRWRAATVPWPGMFVLLFLGGLSGFGIAEFVMVPARGRPSLWFGLLLAALVSAVATAALTVRRRQLRAAGRFEASVAAGIALRTGQVPADPQVRREIRRLLPGQLRLVAGPLRWLPYLLGLVAVGHATIAVSHPRSWLAAALFAALAVGYARWIPRQRRRLDAVARELTN